MRDCLEDMSTKTLKQGKALDANKNFIFCNCASRAERNNMLIFALKREL